MKRIISIAILCSYLLSFTEFHQMLRLPMLVQHFVEHRSQVADMSFWEFLVMHYKTDVVHDEHDMELPFKQCGHSPGAVVMGLPAGKIFLKETALHSKKTHCSFYTRHFTAGSGGDIFQPPRI